MILLPSRKLIAPSYRLAPPTQPRRSRLVPRRRGVRDRFRPSLLNMADGDVMLDPSGNVILDSFGNVLLDNGTTNDCCCGSGSGTCQCGATLGGTVLAVFSGFSNIPDGFSICLTDSGSCAFNGSGTYLSGGLLRTVSLSLHMSNTGGSPSYLLGLNDSLGNSICSASGTFTCDVGGGATISTSGGANCTGTITLSPGAC